VVIDAAGIGSSMAANKVAGVRCALCHDDATALNSREHNDANVMALGCRIVNRGLAQRLVKLFLTTPVRRRPSRAPCPEDHGARTRPLGRRAVRAGLRAPRSS